MKVDVVHSKYYGKANKALLDDSFYIYCGRPSRFGNPYVVGIDGTRKEVIKKFRDNPESKMLIKRLFKSIRELEQENILLGCYCSPLPCHCDVIKEWLLALDKEEQI
jgi:hypothetical protein